jgi:anaerobic C4-dicarboxylate transporter DcuA
VKRILVLALACGLLGLAGYTAVSAMGGRTTAAAPAATTATTGGTTTTSPTTTTPAATTSAEEDVQTSGSEWVLIAIEGLLVVGFIALGVRSGGIGLGLWGGVGTLILVFGFGLDPGEPPFDAMLIIIAVISAAAAMQAAGGVDYMVQIASKALRAKPQAINFVAPYVSYLLCILTGTSNTFYSIIPVINEVSFANKIRPERPLAGSTVASALGITSSPVAAAIGSILPLVAG